jgi:hypothetical protein
MNTKSIFRKSPPRGSCCPATRSRLRPPPPRAASRGRWRGGCRPGRPAGRRAPLGGLAPRRPPVRRPPHRETALGGWPPGRRQCRCRRPSGGRGSAGRAAGRAGARCPRGGEGRRRAGRRPWWRAGSRRTWRRGRAAGSLAPEHSQALAVDPDQRRPVPLRPAGAPVPQPRHLQPHRQEDHPVLLLPGSGGRRGPVAAPPTLLRPLARPEARFPPGPAGLLPAPPPPQG